LKPGSSIQNPRATLGKTSTVIALLAFASYAVLIALLPPPAPVYMPIISADKSTYAMRLFVAAAFPTAHLVGVILGSVSIILEPLRRIWGVIGFTLNGSALVVIGYVAYLVIQLL
jgi:hypothetical protein